MNRAQRLSILAAHQALVGVDDTAARDLKSSLSEAFEVAHTCPFTDNEMDDLWSTPMYGRQAYDALFDGSANIATIKQWLRYAANAATSALEKLERIES